jgi:uncharacterized membrane protein YkvA (DUF1232 family)
MATPHDLEFEPAPGAQTSAPSSAHGGSAQPLPWARVWLGGALRNAAESVGRRYLQRLTGAGGSLRQSLTAVPDRMQLAAQQARLVLELLEDVQNGTYRELRWYSLPVAAAALLYAVSPADLVPDALPWVGVLDDVAVVALAVRLLRNDLRAYCRFKGYPEERYFPTLS